MPADFRAVRIRSNIVGVIHYGSSEPQDPAVHTGSDLVDIESRIDSQRQNLSMNFDGWSGYH